jgi:outer membrane protein
MQSTDTALRLSLTSAATAFWLLLSVFAVPGRMGQEAPDLLTLEQAVRIGLENNEAVENAVLEIEKAELQIFNVRTNRLPQVSLNVTTSQLLTPLRFRLEKGELGTSESTGPVPGEAASLTFPRSLDTVMMIRVAQPLSQLYRIGLSVRTIAVSRDIADQKLKSLRRQVTDEVKRAYYAVLEAESSVESIEEAVRLHCELERLADRQMEQEVVLKADALEIKTRLAKLRYDLILQHNVAALRKEQLNALLGRDVRIAFRVGPPVESAPPEMELEALESVALETRPELTAARLRVEQARLERRLAKSEYLPDISLTFDQLSSFKGEFLPRNLASVGLALNWDVYDWGRRKRQLSEKDKSIRQAQNELRQAENEVLAQVRSAYRALGEARALAAVAEQAEETFGEKLRVAMNKYAQQSVLLRDIIQAEAELADAKHRQRQAHLSAWAARAGLERAIGTN